MNNLKLYFFFIVSIILLTLSASGQSKIYMDVDRMPTYPGELDAVYEYIDEQLTPQKIDDFELTEIEFTLYITFEKDGKIYKAVCFDSTGSPYENKVIDILLNMPKWTPAEINNEPVRLMTTLPYKYNYRPSKDSEAEFPGGNEALLMFLEENLQYPLYAKQEKIQGRVFVNFTIEPDGEITHIQLLRGIGYGCDKEALRVLNLMPKWKPTIQYGVAIKTSINLPILFKL